MVNPRFLSQQLAGGLLLVFGGYVVLPCILTAQAPPVTAQNKSAMGTAEMSAPVQRQLDKLEDALSAARASGDAKAEAKALNQIGNVLLRNSQYIKALDTFNAALIAAKSQKDIKQEVLSLNGIAHCYAGQGIDSKAFDTLNLALDLATSSEDKEDQTTTLYELGSVDRNMGEFQKALEALTRALTLSQNRGKNDSEGLIAEQLGIVYSELGQDQLALEHFNRALTIDREAGNKRGEARALRGVAAIYSRLGQQEKAIDLDSKALLLWQAVGDRGPQASMLNDIGVDYDESGQKQRALEYYQQALAAYRELDDWSGEAIVLQNIGHSQYQTGAMPEALEAFDEALVIARKAGDRFNEAQARNNIGAVYDDLGQKQKALDCYMEALAIRRMIGDIHGEAVLLTNLGRVYLELGERQRALVYWEQALDIERATGDGAGEGNTLSNIGGLYASLGEETKGLDCKMAALSLAKSTHDLDSLGTIDDWLMKYFKGKNLETAILFGTDAVNSFQEIRKRLVEALRAGFVQSKSATYRQLAELLVEGDRLDQAEGVLDLLKEQDLKETVRGAAPDEAKHLQGLSMTPAEKHAESQLDQRDETVRSLARLNLEYSALLVKETRSAEEDARLKVLDMQIESENQDVTSFFENTLYPELARRLASKDANDLRRSEDTEVSNLQGALQKLGPRVLGIRILIGEQHAYAIVVSANGRKKFDLKATPAELKSTVLQVLDDLHSPGSDAKVHLAELYAIVVGPLDAELKALESLPSDNGVPTLLWSLDGVLRYVPIAALFDGEHKRYMVERFDNVLITPESYRLMGAAPADGEAKLRVLAMGLSKSYGGLPALNGVTPELEAVVHDPADTHSHGPMEGKLLENGSFTLASLKSEIGAGNRFGVLHIASHFVVEPANKNGETSEPYLMLGGESAEDPNGFTLTLSKLSNSSLRFGGARLLTLSACSTGKETVAKDGQEMDSLGMIAQQKDAEAVMVTLWDVNDASTSKLMSGFYARWMQNQAAGKGEALRQVQLAFLFGTDAASPNEDRDRGFANSGQRTSHSQGSEYSHPYYWAPFVLMGNWR
jgi:CHAT domain-containing protein/Tfp pilus assembly protein PilF